MQCASKSFTFKQFEVRQTYAAMKVSTDSVLLGAWCILPPHAQHILDIGTGTGILALMAAQRAPHSRIDALEPDKGACEDASFNFEHSPWKANLQVHCTDVQQFIPIRHYDAIVCNPPYFRNSLQAEHNTRNNARHDVSLTLECLLLHVHRLLCPSSGVLSVILPAEYGGILQQEAAQYGLHPSHVLNVKTTSDKPFSRILVALARNTTSATIHTAEHILQERGTPPTYTADHLRLTKDFYLFA